MVAAVFAGVVLMDDEADAVDEGVVYSVDYKVGNITTTITYTSNPITLAAFNNTDGGENTVNANPDDYSGWMGENGSTYSAGSQYTFPTGVITATFTAQPKNVTVTLGDVDAGDDAENPENTLTIGYGATLPIEVKQDGRAGLVAKGTEADAGKVLVDATKTAKDKSVLYFAGWATSKTGDVVGPVVYAAGDDIVLTENVTLYAVYEEDVTVPFYLNGAKVAEAGYHSIISEDTFADSLPDAPEMDNYIFIGWADANGVMVFSWTVDGGYKMASSEYVFTQDVTFTAQFTPVNMTITLMIGDVTYGSPITVLYGNQANAPSLPAGYAYWAVKVSEAIYDDEGNLVTEAVYEEFDFSQAITKDMVLYAMEGAPDENIYVTFNIEGTLYGPYAVNDRFSIPQTDREGYNFLGWTVQGGDGTRLTSEQVQNYQYTEDVTFVAIYEVAEPPAPEEPAFYETTAGQAAIVIVVFVLLFFGYAVYSNMGGLKDKLFGYTISKKEKKE